MTVTQVQRHYNEINTIRGCSFGTYQEVRNCLRKWVFT